MPEHKCLVNKKLKDKAREIYDKLEKKYCVNEIITILALMQAEVNIRASLNGIYEQIGVVLPTKPDDNRMEAG